MEGERLVIIVMEVYDEKGGHPFVRAGNCLQITSALSVVCLKGGLGLGLGGFAEELAAAVNAARCF